MDGTTAGQIGLAPLGYPTTQIPNQNGTLSVNHALTTPLTLTPPIAAGTNIAQQPAPNRPAVQPVAAAPVIAAPPAVTTQPQYPPQPPVPAYAPPMPPVTAVPTAMQSTAKPVEAFALPTIINIPSEPMLPPALPLAAPAVTLPQSVVTPAQNPAMVDAASMAQEQHLQQVENKLLDVNALQNPGTAPQASSIPMPPAVTVATAVQPPVVPVAVAPKPATSVSDYFQNNTPQAVSLATPKSPKFNLHNINTAALKKVGIIVAIVIVLGVGGYFVVHAVMGSHTTKTAAPTDTSNSTKAQNTSSSDSTTNPTTLPTTDTPATTLQDNTTSGTSQGTTTAPVTTTTPDSTTTPAVTPTPVATPTPAPPTPAIPDTGVR
jgi:hypothetical protein